MFTLFFVDILTPFGLGAWSLIIIKGEVHPNMKITPCFTHRKTIPGVYDFLLSDEYNQSYIKKCPGCSELNNGSEWGLRIWSRAVQLIEFDSHAHLVSKAGYA